jgi:hypothetical protein
MRNRVKLLLKMCGHAFLSTIHERLDVLERYTRNAAFPETQAALLQASIHTVETLHELADRVVVETHDAKLQSPEVGLIEFLYSFLPTRKAVTTRETAACLQSCGYEVSIFEPGQAIPGDAGVVWMDTPRNSSSPVTIISFRNRVEDAVREMRSQGYSWHIVLYSVPEKRAAYYSNYAGAPPNSSGNIFFFRDYNTFAQAQAWCSAVLPRTYFKPANSKYSTTESIPRE